MDEIPAGFSDTRPIAEELVQCANAYDGLKQRIADLENELRLFCAKVDAGEIRSFTTAARFLALLNGATAESLNTYKELQRLQKTP